MNCRKAWAWPFVLFAILIVSCLILPARGWAQDDNWNQDNDPPARVARLNYIQGYVSFQPGGEGDWVDAVPNRPMTTGDDLWTDHDARAELHAGSTSLRLGGETSLTFLELDDHVMQLRLAQGSLLVRVRHLDDDDMVEIDTPNLAFTVMRTGEYRVNVDPEGRTTFVDVFQGRGEAIGGGNNYTVVAGQEASFTGDADQGLGYDLEPLPRPDDFGRWAFDRDRREDESQSANYVSPEMTGYEDLDDNGSWSFAGGYGPVWYPTAIPAGWAPYRFGHWVWVAPWGWTWVDDAPWGFAPFHYGRWSMIGGRWGWIPGPVAAHPVYAPALVAFVGGGGGFHIGGGVGVAWFPLGPGEVFVPSYHVSRTYVNQVNVTNTVVNVTKVTNVYNTYTTNNVTVNKITYVNQTSVTAVSRDTFVNARPVAHNVVVVQQKDIEQAPISHMSGVEPVHGSVMGAGKPSSVAPPKAVLARQVVAQHAPVAPPTPFAQRQDKLLVRPAAVVNQPMNARPTNQPMNNQPGNRPEPAMTRPQAPASVPAQVERQIPQPQPRPENQAARPAEQQPQPARPAPAQTEPMRQQAPRENTMPVQQSRPQEAPQAQRGQPERTQPEQGWSHPQARPAPPVQPKSESQAKDEENKYRNWQQQAPKAQPPAAKPEPPKQEDKKKH